MFLLYFSYSRWTLGAPPSIFMASRQQTSVPQHLCGLHWRTEGEIGRPYFLMFFSKRIKKPHVKYHTEGFLQGNPTESIHQSFFWCGNIIETYLKHSKKHEMPGAPQHGGKSAGRVARIAPWCPSSWDGTCDIWVSENGVCIPKWMFSNGKHDDYMINCWILGYPVSDKIYLFVCV